MNKTLIISFRVCTNLDFPVLMYAKPFKINSRVPIVLALRTKMSVSMIRFVFQTYFARLKRLRHRGPAFT